jgi:two-component system NtrC family sensor kinase
MRPKLAIDRRLRRRVLPAMLLVITLLMAISLALRIDGVKKHNLAVATEGARNIFRMIVLTRQWNAEHGGVYVFASDKTPSNNYLEHPQRDLELKDKRVLTMLNPAYMTRQIAELAANDPQLRLRLHITSLKPIRPENAADAWEAGALKRFEQGQMEIASVEQENGQSYLRYMAPLMVNQACMSCHEKQGYKIGDVRGGISVSLQFKAIEQTMHNEIFANILSHGVFYGLLVLISWGLIELLARRWRALDDTIETLQVTRNELVENEKMASLGRLVAGFAHELNTPVGVAVGAISHGDETIDKLTALLAKDEVTEQELTSQLAYLRESHHMALANLRRAADLVQRFKRTSIDRGSPHKRTYLLSELIQDVLTALRNTLKHIAVDIEVDCPESLKLYGTPGLLEQVLTNLITNSISHGFDNGNRSGRIEIKARLTEAQRLVIDYRDNGIGMDEEIRRRAFEPFFTTRRAKGGSGLGLYVIYNIITQQMAGTIHIVSAPGTGTLFHIDCPIEPTPL